MRKDEANYMIDRALAHGQLDSQGNLCFTVKGHSAAEMAVQIIEVAALWVNRFPPMMRGKWHLTKSPALSFGAPFRGGLRSALR